MDPPRSIRYPTSRKRKTTTITAILSADATLVEARTPLGEISTNASVRRTTTVATELGGTKTLFLSDTENMNSDTEMIQGEPKRVCTDKTAQPRAESPDRLQPCETIMEGIEAEGNTSIAESVADADVDSEMSRLTTETRSSGATDSSVDRPQTRSLSQQKNRKSKSYE
jgi:hypothetical protein